MATNNTLVLGIGNTLLSDEGVGVRMLAYLKDNYPDIDITVFYTDLRAFGKGFEELLMRSKMSAVRYIRGLPGDVREKPDGNLFVTVENTTANRLEIHEFEMLVQRCSVGNRVGSTGCKSGLVQERGLFLRR